MIARRHEDHVTTLVVSRPEKRNALNWATIRELADGIDAAEADPDCRCLLITGEGEHFVAGRDLEEASADATLDEALANEFRRGRRAFDVGETVAGAKAFAGGKGRGGRFDDFA